MEIQAIVLVPAGASEIIGFGSSTRTIVNGPITITFTSGGVHIVIGDNFVEDPVARGQIGLAIVRSVTALFTEGIIRDEMLKLTETLGRT